jgi:RIO kinase 1
MKSTDLTEMFEQLDESGHTYRGYSHKQRGRAFSRAVAGRMQEYFHSADDSRASFHFTYKASRHEQGWLLDSLGFFYEHRHITDVLRVIKGGKEATVYLCRGGPAVKPAWVAAKVYRPRMLRNLRNDQQYRLGRTYLDEDGKELTSEHEIKAVLKREGFGEAVRHQSWIAYELNALKTLHRAGADVPEPFESGHNAILMSYIGDKVYAAPTLNSVKLEPAEARPLFERVVHNIDLMLSNGIIHGDLSAFNILFWDGVITLIDFPQVVLPDANPQAWPIFRRDVHRVCAYFTAQGVRCDPGQLAIDLWRSHGRKAVAEAHPRYLDPDDPNDRRLWQEQKQNV